MRKIGVSTAKGGVGKTTAAVNLSAGLALAGKRVLLVDLDPQGNSGGHVGIDAEHTLSELLSTAAQDVIIEVRPNLHIITSGRERLYDAQRELMRNDFGVDVFDERMEFIKKIGYDFVFCDFSPTDTFINRAALLFCDELLIPISPGLDAIMGANRYIDLAGMQDGPRIKRGKARVSVLGVLLNMFEPSVVLSREIERAAVEQWGEKVFKTRIRKNVSLGEARVQNKTIFEYAPGSHGAEDFKALSAEVLNGKEA
jgi:chromosome partitioning protein